MFFLVAILLIFIPNSAFAWGPGVHIGVSLSIIDSIDPQSAYIILSNINEYLYGSLAPDFIIGKKYSSSNKHSHNWDIGFKLLENASFDKNRAFAFGYLSHLASDAVAHSIMVPNLTDSCIHKNGKHIYLEMFADALCQKRYKDLAKKILTKYNKKLDNQFKEKVDSVLFSFSVSKIIFKGMTRLAFNKNITQIVLKEGFMNYFNIQTSTIANYIELSKEFSIDVLKNKRNSSVTNINAKSI